MRPGQTHLDRPFRRGDRCVLIEDHTNLDGSIIIKAKGTEGTIVRRYDSIARVRFDDGGLIEVVFVHKLAYMPKQKGRPTARQLLDRDPAEECPCLSGEPHICPVHNPGFRRVLL